MQRLRIVLGCSLGLMLATLTLPSQTATGNSPPVNPKQHPLAARQTHNAGEQALDNDERALHALSRLTFGPRPGDVERVRAIGLEQWFELQLQPATMDFADLDRRLNQFPAMRLPTPQLLKAFPSGAIIRQTVDGKLAVPNSPILRTVYSDQIAFYKEREAKKAEAATALTMAKDASPVAPEMRGGAMDAANAQMASGMQASGSQPDALAAPGAMMAMGDGDKAKSAESASARPSFPDADVQAILELQPKQRVMRLLAMSPQQLESLSQSLKGPQRAQLVDKMTAGEREVVADLENPSKAVVDELMEQRLMRDVYSPAQLQEVMTDFWLNHFNVYLHKNEETPYYVVSFERDVIRPRALGRFEDLLVATAESPAMLLYLDNASSMGPDSTVAEKDKERAQRQNKPLPPSGLNENYARELMELHTLGVDGGYTQHDITEMARVFTGWTVDQPAHGGGFLFDERKHEPGTKKLLGVKVKDGGINEGLEMLHRLAMRPATAQFLSRKLAVRFVSDDPPQSLVNRMAKSYLASDGDIATVLRTMFHSPEFWQRDVYRAKVKTPLEYVVSAVRASNADTSSLMQLSYALNNMGMPLYGCVPPTGYSANAQAWVNTGALVTRMNFALNLAANKLAGIQTAWPADAVAGDLGREVAGDAAQMDVTADELRLENRLIQGDVSEQTRKTLLEQVGSQPEARTENAGTQSAVAQPINTAAQVIGKQRSTNPANPPAAREKQDALLAGLLLGSPEFQRR
jgi:uncharacterized protein (DUF1800 family)